MLLNERGRREITYTDSAPIYFMIKDTMSTRGFHLAWLQKSRFRFSFESNASARFLGTESVPALNAKECVWVGPRVTVTTGRTRGYGEERQRDLSYRTSDAPGMGVTSEALLHTGKEL